MTPAVPGRTHLARRRFGQNFLHDSVVIGQIVNAIGATREQAIVEIGPGLGALTGPLLSHCGELNVVELDRDLARELPARLGHAVGLKVHQADALKFDFRTLARCGERLRVVGNLPYNISSPLLFHLIEQRDIIDDMHFMLQLEVVNRLVAKPGTRAYGRLSIVMQLLCAADKIFEVEPESFSPVPKVRSALVRLAVREHPAAEIADTACFDDLVRRAFAQRRKTLRNTLRGVVSAAQWEASGIDPGRRAETLHLVDFARLSNEVSG